MQDERDTTMRKTFLGLAVIAAVATPLAFASSASADVVSADSDLRAGRGRAREHRRLTYKYSPVKSSDGPTQWDDDDAPASTAKTWVVKGKTVELRPRRHQDHDHHRRTPPSRA